MSRFVWTRIFLPIIISIGVTFLFIYVLFEALGITETVWPILFPILGTTFGIMVIVIVIAGIACSAGQKRQNIPTNEEMIRRAYIQPPFRTRDYSDGAIYTVPMYCPHCKYKIELSQVEWVGSSELTCSNCFRVIQTGVRESL